VKVEEDFTNEGGRGRRRDVGREKATGADVLPMAFRFLAARH
jgi:hypothetical protein